MPLRLYASPECDVVEAFFRAFSYRDDEFCGNLRIAGFVVIRAISGRMFELTYRLGDELGRCGCMRVRCGYAKVYDRSPFVRYDGCRGDGVLFRKSAREGERSFERGFRSISSGLMVCIAFLAPCIFSDGAS